MRARVQPASIGVAAAVLAIGIALGFALAYSQSKREQLTIDIDPTQAARDIDAARTAVSSPQNAFLDDFNSGKRSVSELPRGELAADSLEPAGLDDTVAASSAVVLATATRVYFHGSGMQDIPGATITYMVERRFKGSLAKGDTFDIDFVGGPYRQPTGEEIFLQAPLEPIAAVGDRSLLMLKQTGDGYWYRISTGAKLALVDGKVQGMPPDAGWTSEWTGRSEKDLLDHVAAITK